MGVNREGASRWTGIPLPLILPQDCPWTGVDNAVQPCYHGISSIREVPAMAMVNTVSGPTTCVHCGISFYTAATCNEHQRACLFRCAHCGDTAAVFCYPQDTYLCDTCGGDCDHNRGHHDPA